jgi:hypothetical protein
MNYKECADVARKISSDCSGDLCYYEVMSSRTWNKPMHVIQMCEGHKRGQHPLRKMSEAEALQELMISELDK